MHLVFKMPRHDLHVCGNIRGKSTDEKISGPALLLS